MGDYRDALESGGDEAVRAMEADRQQNIKMLLGTMTWEQQKAFMFLFAAVARPRAFTDCRNGRSAAGSRYLKYWHGQLHRFIELLSDNRFFFEPIFEALTDGKKLDPHADQDFHDLMCGVCSISTKQEDFVFEVLNTYKLIKEFTPT